MAVLNIISAVDVKVFNDFPWALILNVGMSGIAMYALRIILLVAIIKIVLFPLDLFQKYKMRKNQLITRRLKPQMDKLQKAYANDPQVLQQKQAQLNRKEGMSYFASCLPMIVTLVIFIWFWQTLSTTAQYKQFESYIEIYNVYSSAYVENLGDYYSEEENGLSDDYAEDFISAFNAGISASPSPESQDSIDEAYASAIAANSTKAFARTGYYDLYVLTYKSYYSAALEKYIPSRGLDSAITLAVEAGKNNASAKVNDYCGILAQNNVHDYYFGEGEYEGNGYERDSFLWIKDIWSPDVPWTSSIKKTKSEFVSGIGEYATNADKSGLDETTLDRAVNAYDGIMSLVLSDDRINVNGFLVLPILAVGLNVLSQLITKKQQKDSGQAMSNDTQMGCMNNAMLFMFPVMIGFFALNYCAAFTLYMLTNTGISLIFNLFTSLLTKRMIPTNLVEGSGGEMIEKYGRPDFSNKK